MCHSCYTKYAFGFESVATAIESQLWKTITAKLTSLNDMQCIEIQIIEYDYLLFIYLT